MKILDKLKEDVLDYAQVAATALIQVSVPVHI